MFASVMWASTRSSKVHNRQIGIYKLNVRFTINNVTNNHINVKYCFIRSNNFDYMNYANALCGYAACGG